ncbi:MAG: hypothetical protein ACYDGR_15150, partial [Candidatus Dormibacteria bacterium]
MSSAVTRGIACPRAFGLLFLALIAWAAPVLPAVASGAFPGQYHALVPTRILDTRNGTGGLHSPIGPGQTLEVQVGGAGGVDQGAIAAALNVTVTNPSKASFLELWPAGQARPTASSLNWAAGQTVANLVQLPLGLDGRLGIFNESGTADVVIDTEGWISSQGSAPSGTGLFRPLVPARILDTRYNLGTSGGAMTQGQTLDLQVSPAGNVPASGVAAVLLNITATNPSSTSFLTAFPAGGQVPVASNVNFVAGQTSANRAIVPVGNSGMVSLHNSLGAVDVVVDVSGWFTDSSSGAAQGGAFTGQPPARVLDTRSSGMIPPRQAVSLQLAGTAGIPPGASAALFNLTVANPDGVGFVSVYPSGDALPLSSDLNYDTGMNVANLVAAKIGPDGKVLLYNSGADSQLIVDVVGWYGAVPTNGAPPSVPSITGAAASGYEGVTLAWNPPATDGGSQVVTYTATINPGGWSLPTDGRPRHVPH